MNMPVRNRDTHTAAATLRCGHCVREAMRIVCYSSKYDYGMAEDWRTT